MRIVLFSITMIFVATIPNTILLREVLYSIFVGGSSDSRSRRKEAEKIHRAQSPLNRVFLSYIPRYLKKYTDAFKLYSKIYHIYTVVGALVFVWFTTILFHGLIRLFVICWSVFGLINVAFFAVVYVIAGVGADHRTKYDR